MNPMRDAINAVEIEVPDVFTLDLEGEEAMTQEQQPEVCILSEFAHEALFMVAHSHLWHLQTESFAAHKAFGDFYDELPGLVDIFLEAAIGVNGPINPSQGSFTFDSSENAVAIIKAFHQSIHELHSAFQDSPCLTNPLEDIMTLCAGTEYKLQYLH